METKFKYAVRKAGSNYGIEDIKQLKDLVAKGKVDAGDFVFNYKTEEWKRLGELSELRVFFPAFNAGATTRTPSSDNINSLPNLRQIEAAQKSNSTSSNNNSSSRIAASTFRSKNESSQSRLDVGSLFAGVPDKPAAGKSSPGIAKNSASSTLLTPFTPGASSGSRPAQNTLPRPGVGQSSRIPAQPAAASGALSSSNKLPRLTEAEAPSTSLTQALAIGAVSQEPLPQSRPNYLRYVLFLVLVAIASGAITFFVMRGSNDDAIAMGSPLPVRSSR